MILILQDDTLAIKKSKLCQGKRYTMLLLIQLVLGGLPLKIRTSFHTNSIQQD